MTNRVTSIINNEKEHIPAGGLLIYDDDGIWLLKEKKTSKGRWNDYGGRNRGEDCDLATTIAREVCEEFYQSIEVTRSHVIQIANSIPPTTLSYNGKVCYVCFIVHINLIHSLSITLPSRETFFEFKRRAIENNPHFRYITVDYKHIPFDDLKRVVLDNRVRGLLIQKFPQYF